MGMGTKKRGKRQALPWQNAKATDGGDIHFPDDVLFFFYLTKNKKIINIHSGYPIAGGGLFFNKNRKIFVFSFHFVLIFAYGLCIIRL